MTLAIHSVVFFKAATTEGAYTTARGMLGLDGLTISTSIASADWLIAYLIGGFAIIYLLPNTQQFFIDHEPSLEPERNETLWGLEKLKWSPDWRWAIVFAGLFAFAFTNLSRVSEFIYFQF